MLKISKRLLFIFFAISYVLINLSVFAALKPSKEFFINDYAEVLSEDTKKCILDNSAALFEKTKAQIVVVTVKSLEGKDLDSYSLELFRDWDIGDKKLNNGLLILLSTEDRKVKMEVGDGLEGRINDSKAGRFLDEYAIPSFKNSDWDTGIKMLYLALLEEVYKEYDMQVPEEVSSVIMEYRNTSDEGDIGILAGVVIVALVLVFGGIVPFFLRRRYPKFYDSYMGGSSGGFWDNHHHGGGGGGSFGGFSGGGGTASGGGASRSF